MTNSPIQPEFLDQWFPLAQQRDYIDRIMQIQSGLTRRKAECFIRLWAYLMLKQLAHASAASTPQKPITQLMPIEGAVVCTHREAAELFYARTERGSDRAAGMMLDQLVQMGLISKTFDGNFTSLRVRSVAELTASHSVPVDFKLDPDRFDPRADAIPIASILAENYSWMTDSTTGLAHKIAKHLRRWAGLYSQGMRVLRRSDNRQAVGCYVLFPTAGISEVNFFLPPTQSLHLITAAEVDPITVAQPGDLDCLSIFVRSWVIDPAHLSAANVCLSLQDAQHTLRQLQKDFPNLCDLYAMPLHPQYEALASELGFQKTIQDPKNRLYWTYMALDRFLELEIESAIDRLFST